MRSGCLSDLAPLLALSLSLLGGCARDPVVAVTLTAVPAEATALEVWP